MTLAALIGRLARCRAARVRWQAGIAHLGPRGRTLRGVIAAILALTVSLTLGGAAARASNEPAKARLEMAKARWKQAAVEYALGHFSVAALRYEEAYRLHQEPALLFNIAQAKRLSGAKEQALAAYKSFLREAPENAANRELAKRRIEELKASIARSAPKTRAIGRFPTSHPAASELPSLAPSRLVPGPNVGRDGTQTQAWRWAAAGGVVIGVGLVTTFLLVRGNARDPVRGTAGHATLP